jgi:hypothetical protein
MVIAGGGGAGGIYILQYTHRLTEYNKEENAPEKAEEQKIKELERR